MTQKHVQISAYAVLLIVGVGTAWAEAKKETSRELLPAPRCCCEVSSSVRDGAETNSSPCCAKQAQNFTASCCKPCDIEHWLQTACPLDITLQIVVDEPAFREAGISLAEPLILNTKWMSLGNLLSSLLRQAHLAYVIKDKVIQITTDAQACDKIVNKIYPVGNLVSPAEPIILPMGYRDVFFGWLTRTPAGLRLQEETPEDELVNLITSSIKPQSWCDNGGSGTIDYVAVSKSLVVNQTIDVQQQIEDLLAALGRLQEQQAEACERAPFASMPLPMPPPLAAPPPSPPIGMATPMPQFFPPAVPPAFSFGRIAVPAPYPPPASVRPAPAYPSAGKDSASANRAYVLRVKLSQCSPNGNTTGSPAQEQPAGNRIFGVGVNSDGTEPYQLAVTPDGQFVYVPTNAGLTGTVVLNERKCPVAQQLMEICLPVRQGSHADALMAGAEGKGRSELLHVRATVLKDGRVHVALMDVEARVEKRSEGDVAVHLDAKPPVDAKVKVHKTVRKPLEKDQAGNARKWVELSLELLEQTPLGVVWPSPADAPTPAETLTATYPRPEMMTAMACQPTCPVIAPAPAVSQYFAAQPQDGPGSTWRVRSVDLDGKTTLIIRDGDHDSVTLDCLEIRIPGNDSLRITTAGERIHAENGCLEVQADAVCRTGQPGCFLFEGNVILARKRDDAVEKVIGERVWINLVNGEYRAGR